MYSNVVGEWATEDGRPYNNYDVINNIADYHLVDTIESCHNRCNHNARYRWFID